MSTRTGSKTVPNRVATAWIRIMRRPKRRAQTLGKGLDPRTAHGTALTILNVEEQTQSFIMAYSDSFLVVGLILFASCFALLFLPQACQGSERSIHRLKSRILQGLLWGVYPIATHEFSE